MSFSFPSSVVADRIGRNEPPAPWQSSKRIETFQIEDEPKEIIPSGFLYLSYLSIRGLECRFCEFSVFRFLGGSQIARARARARARLVLARAASSCLLVLVLALLLILEIFLCLLKSLPGPALFAKTLYIFYIHCFVFIIKHAPLCAILRCVLQPD